MKDFFISYNKADKQWAEWIAWQLEEATYTTVLQAWDFKPGTNFVLMMHKAAKEAERTIAVLSPDYLTSIFTKPEWAAAFAQDPTGEKGLLIPIRVRECDPEGLLHQIGYEDLVHLDAVAAKSTLLALVKRERAKPLVAPTFPRIHRAERAAVRSSGGTGYLAPAVYRASGRQYDLLAEFLVDIIELQDVAVRTQLAAALPPQLQQQVSWVSEQWSSQLAVSAFEHDGGLALEDALRVLVRDFSKASVLLKRLRAIVELREQINLQPIATSVLQQLYFLSVPDIHRAPAGKDLESILEGLLEVAPRAPGKLHPIYEFAERLAHSQNVQALRQWVEQQVPSLPLLQDLRERIEREARAVAPVTHLVIDAVPSQDGFLHFWVYSGQTGVALHDVIPCSATSFEASQAVILQIIERVGNHTTGELSIELFVPFEGLHWAIEEVEIEGSDSLGELYPVLLRWRDRAQGHSSARSPAWHERARQIHGDKRLTHQPVADWLELSHRVRRVKAGLGWEGTCVAFLFVPAQTGEAGSELLRAALLGGAPYALWSRREVADWSAFRDLIDKVLLLGNLESLPFRTREHLRSNRAFETLSVAILWDDPQRNPLGLQFSTLSDREA